MKWTSQRGVLTGRPPCSRARRRQVRLMCRLVAEHCVPFSTLCLLSCFSMIISQRQTLTSRYRSICSPHSVSDQPPSSSEGVAARPVGSHAASQSTSSSILCCHSRQEPSCAQGFEMLGRGWDMSQSDTGCAGINANRQASILESIRADAPLAPS